MQKLREYIYHKLLLGQNKCPYCGTWANIQGPVPITGLDEYKCLKCNKFFQK